VAAGLVVGMFVAVTLASAVLLRVFGGLGRGNGFW
jgi:hypothetical protein